MLEDALSISLRRSQETKPSARQATCLSLGFRTEGPKVHFDRAFSHPDPHLYPTVPVSYSLSRRISAVPGHPDRAFSHRTHITRQLSGSRLTHSPPCHTPSTSVPFPSINRAFPQQRSCLFPSSPVLFPITHTLHNILIYCFILTFFYSFADLVFFSSLY